MTERLRVGILFGGPSAEHEVSLLSARNVIAGIDRQKYAIVPIGIDKAGRWFLVDETNRFFAGNSLQPFLPDTSCKEIVWQLGHVQHPLRWAVDSQRAVPIDVVFPVLHGPYGEDGTVQGLLRAARLPFVGADVLGSAIGMDKEVMKRLLREAHLPVVRFLTVVATQCRMEAVQELVQTQIGYPCFVKPANLGSSVGIGKVLHATALVAAIREAFQYDTKILIEEAIEGREIECAVLDAEVPIASVPGEIIPRHEFYSYAAKYVDENGAALEIPAKLPAALIEEVKTRSLRAFQALGIIGMARVDFFLHPSRGLIVNELNTIPGFTDISMYPKLWEASGVPLVSLIDRLIALAITYHRRRQQLSLSPSLSQG